MLQPHRHGLAGELDVLDPLVELAELRGDLGGRLDDGIRRGLRRLPRERKVHTSAGLLHRHGDGLQFRLVEEREPEDRERDPALRLGLRLHQHVDRVGERQGRDARLGAAVGVRRLRRAHHDLRAREVHHARAVDDFARDAVNRCELIRRPARGVEDLLPVEPQERERLRIRVEPEALALLHVVPRAVLRAQARQVAAEDQRLHDLRLRLALAYREALLVALRHCHLPLFGAPSLRWLLVARAGKPSRPAATAGAGRPRGHSARGGIVSAVRSAPSARSTASACVAPSPNADGHTIA